MEQFTDKMIKALILDLDDTLLDTTQKIEPLWYDALLYFLEQKTGKTKTSNC